MNQNSKLNSDIETATNPIWDLSSRPARIQKWIVPHAGLSLVFEQKTRCRFLVLARGKRKGALMSFYLSAETKREI